MFNSYLYILSVDCTVPDISMLNYMVDGLMPGSTITYFCDGDYYLPGTADSVQVCLQSGEWNGTVPTACVKGMCSSQSVGLCPTYQHRFFFNSDSNIIV